MAKFQIGKLGVNAGVIDSLKLYFKTHKVVRVSVLKGSLRGREEVRKMAGELVSGLGENYDCQLIGFTIIVRKFGKKAKRQDL